MLRTLLQSLKTGVVTSRYPEVAAQVPDRFRGAPELRDGRPYDSLPPASVCPTGAIAATPTAATIDLARCIFCGRCGEAPPEGPIHLGQDFELAARRRQDLLVGIGRDALGHAVPRAAGGPELAEQVSERIRRTLSRSLHLRHLDSGSCNACDWELTALLSPFYDVRRLGIDFVASPRHADGVIVTGPVTRNLEAAVRRTWDAVPDPRIAIAVGACACSGGIVGTSYASAGGVEQVLPVDVYIPGCPPRPEAIIFGILVAVGRLDARRRGAEAPPRPAPDPRDAGVGEGPSS